MNTGDSPTYVCDRGSSFIDLTWVSADVCALVSGWRVLSDAISLSDHKYIAFRIGGLRIGQVFRHAHYARWNTKTLDRELFRETLSWLYEGGHPVDSVEGWSLHIADMMSTACRVSANRLKYHSSKRGVYWWSEEVSQARRRCIAAKRLLTKRRRRGGMKADPGARVQRPL